MQWARRILFLGCALVLFATFAVRAAPAAPVELAPRVFLPMTARVWQDDSLAELPFGTSDSTVTKLVDAPAAIELMTAAEARYNRTSIYWSNVEPSDTTPENYLWQRADKNINPLLANGIQPFVLIMKNPTWAASTSCGPVNDPEAMAEFVAALAARYPQVRYWALYNEVDGATYSANFETGGCFGEDDLDGNGKPDYADYAELARTVWKRMHAANPNAQLSIGQLAYDNFTPASRPPWYPGGCCFNYLFLNNLMQYMSEHPLPNGEKYGDVLAFNDYWYYNENVWQYRYPDPGVGAKAAALREVMAQYGQSFPLAITEMSGSSTHSPNGVTPEFQARQLAQMMAQGMFYDIRTLIWWTWDDYPDSCAESPQCKNFKFGLLTQEHAPKLAYYAQKVVAEQLRGYTADKLTQNEQLVRLRFKKGDVKKIVVYAKSEAATQVTFKAKTLRVVDMFGNVNFYQQKDKRRISIAVTPDPLYVEINP